MTTFLWYDYESHDKDPLYARPASFAAIRTDMDLKQIGEPLHLLFRPANDFLPHPRALLIHRLQVSRLQRDGLPEVDCAHAIYKAKTIPETISLGFNTATFDSKMTHALFHRNLLPQYRWHTGDNTRFDIHDVIRLVVAVEPSTLTIPLRDGSPSMRLEDLCKANDIEHEAHDALFDVRATIALAQRIKTAHPDLWDLSIRNRTVPSLTNLLNPAKREIFLHAAPYYGADRSYVAPLLPMGTSDKNTMIAVDLARPLDQLLTLSAEEIRRLLFTRKEELPEGSIRPPLQTIRLNHSPAIIPLSTLSETRLQHAKIDRDQCNKAAQTIHEASNLFAKFASVMGREAFTEGNGEDLDDQVYGGGFASRPDENEMMRFLQIGPKKTAEAKPSFQDTKYRRLHDRLVARNYPELMQTERRNIWDTLRLDYIHGRKPRKGLTLTEFNTELEQARTQAATENDQAGLDLLSDLERYVSDLQRT